jgi:hypothetical protein
MIYKKDANFPYPVLNNLSNSYTNNKFELNIKLKENSDEYIFELEYEIGSDFIIKNIKNDIADIFLIISSQDNKFIKLNPINKYDNIFKNKVKILKRRLSLNQKTELQLLIKADKDINFYNNYDLKGFYNQYKSQIIVHKNGMLAFSNTISYNGLLKESIELFENRINKDQKPEIKIEISEETIILNYKKDDYMFRSLADGQKLNYPYIYMGLQKALFNFINKNGDPDLEFVEMNQIETSNFSNLDVKLYNLIKSKGIDSFGYDEIDDVISSISDKIIEKFSLAVGRLSNGN